MLTRNSTNFCLLFRRILFLLCLILINLSSADTHQTQDSTRKNKGRAAPARRSSHIVVITIDGLRADSLSNKDTLLQLPHFKSLIEKGAGTNSIESIYPSLTFPAYASIITGMLPTDHGITEDYPFDEQRGEISSVLRESAQTIKTETIWMAAQRHHISTAAIGFPLTKDALITFNLSDDLLKETSALTTTGKKAKRETILAQAVERDRQRAVAAAKIIEEQRPGILFTRFSSFAQAQQLYGISAEENVTIIRQIDEFVGLITSASERVGIGDRTTVIIVSPFGSARAEKEFRPNVVLAKKKLLSREADGKITKWKALAVPLGGAAAIYLHTPDDAAIAREAEKAFQEIYNKPHSPIWRIISRREISQMGADPRAAFYIESAPGVVISGVATGDMESGTEKAVIHGWLPQRYEMRGAFIITGCAIKPGASVEYARLTDIAPTIAGLLGFEMKTARGRILSEIISDESADRKNPNQ